LRLDLGEDLPAIRADRGQMRQMLRDLVLNAGEATGAGGGVVAVKTSIQDVDAPFLGRYPDAAELPPGQYVCLEVRDAGCGMDAAIKTRIFDPFFSTKFTGRGLGLAAVAGTVRGHKGAVLVTSAPGQGACFTVLLPAESEP
jgi:signal transduction histidine kinase